MSGSGDVTDMLKHDGVIKAVRAEEEDVALRQSQHTAEVIHKGLGPPAASRVQQPLSHLWRDGITVNLPVR